MRWRRVAGLVLVSFAAAGCAGVRLPSSFPRIGEKRVDRPPRKPEDPRKDPRTDPAVGAPRTANVDPGTMETLYRAVHVYLVEKRDDEAYQTLTQITRVSPQYKDCPALLREVRTRLVRQHYQEGLRLFREEKLEQAIVQWRLVLDMDPTQGNARRNIDQAEQMLRTLAEHRGGRP